MFSTDFIFRQQENLVDNQKSQAGFRPLRNKILFPLSFYDLLAKILVIKKNSSNYLNIFSYLSDLVLAVLAVVVGHRGLHALPPTIDLKAH